MTGHTIVRDLLSTVFAVKFPVRIHGHFKQVITLSSCSFCMCILRCFSEKLHTTQWTMATAYLYCWQWCFECQMWYYFLTEKKFVWVRNYMFWICDVLNFSDKNIWFKKGACEPYYLGDAHLSCGSHRFIVILVEHNFEVNGTWNSITFSHLINVKYVKNISLSKNHVKQHLNYCHFKRMSFLICFWRQCQKETWIIGIS